MCSIYLHCLAANLLFNSSEALPQNTCPSYVLELFSDPYFHEIHTQIIHQDLFDEMCVTVVKLTTIDKIVNQSLGVLPE